MGISDGTRNPDHKGTNTIGREVLEEIVGDAHRVSWFLGVTFHFLGLPEPIVPCGLRLLVLDLTGGSNTRPKDEPPSKSKNQDAWEVLGLRPIKPSCRSKKASGGLESRK